MDVSLRIQNVSVQDPGGKGSSLGKDHRLLLAAGLPYKVPQPSLPFTSSVDG